MVIPLHAFYLTDFSAFKPVAVALDNFQMEVIFAISGIFAARLAVSPSTLGRRILVLGVPFLFCVLVLNPLSLLFHLHRQGSDVTAASYVAEIQQRFLSGDLTLHAWFLACLLAYTMIAGPLAGFLRSDRARALGQRLSRTVPGPLQLLSLSVAIAAYVLVVHVVYRIALAPLGVPYLGASILEYLPIFSIGMALGLYPHLFSAAHRVDGVLLTATCALWIWWISFPPEGHFQQLYGRALIAQTTTLSALTAGLWLFRRYFNATGRVAASLSEASYTIFVLQWVVLYALDAALPLGDLAHGARFLVLTIATLGVTWAAHRCVIARWPAASWLVNGSGRSRTGRAGPQRVSAQNDAVTRGVPASSS